MAKHDKGATPAQKRKIEAERKRQLAEKLERAKQNAYFKAYKRSVLMAAKQQGMVDGAKAAAKKGKGKRAVK